ncbi:MAG: efflux RND transporter permease subunit [Candidatus Brocadiae bacterium]|nr:efflux RND transporter permease subunit [Candidatus Brocadiia bacterium]
MCLIFSFLIALGITSYQNLGRLSYPDFTIKIALISTSYPGASPQEVEEEVTDIVEEAAQSLGGIDNVKSTSQSGLSMVFVELKDSVHSRQVPQAWDELRRKISDAQKRLPPGAGPSIVNDDFGDVYGIFFAITGEDYSYKELRKYARTLKKELLLVPEVAKVDFWGLQREAIYVEFDRAKMSQIGVSPGQIYQTISLQNAVEPMGKVKIGTEYIPLRSSGSFSCIDSIENLYLSGKKEKLVRLGDIASVSRGYIDPPESLLRFNGKKGIGIGISAEAGSNVVRMGNAVIKRLKELEKIQPAGIELHKISFQAENVTESLDTFIENFVEAIAIVVFLLLLFMGWRAGLIIASVLILSILGTFIGMLVLKIDLQLISLGALIIALGVLVDNAIVVVDVFMVKREKGIDKETAAIESVQETQIPLLGATLVAILAFVPVGFNPGNVGEFCRSLFDVMAISLFLSWILAITLAPILCIHFLKNPPKTMGNPYETSGYRKYRRFLHAIIQNKAITLVFLTLLIGISLYGFERIPRFFFSESTRNQFYIDYWRSQGSHIDETSEDMKKIEAYLLSQPEIRSVTSFIGQGALRFVLSYNFQLPNTSFGQLLVEVQDYRQIHDLIARAEKYLKDNFPDSDPKINRFQEGPPVEYSVEIRFRGPDPKILYSLAEQAKKVLYESQGAKTIRDDWRQSVKLLNLKYSQVEGRFSGVTRSDVSSALLWNFYGITIGLYRENEDLIPILSRPAKEERQSILNLDKIQVWSNIANTYIPIRQVVSAVDTDSEPGMIKRRNRVRSLMVQCNHIVGQASTLRDRILEKIESIDIPPGYSLEWAGEHEESKKGQAGLKKVFPVCLFGMFLLVVMMFNSIRQPLIIFLTIPLAFVGVTAGLLSFSLPFGFMAILGFLGLTGMLVKNAIVLLDQINLDLQLGKKPYDAVLDASVSRLRPVTMAAGTTILGMLPLIWHPFFAAMAATLMGGLLIATGLTLCIVPLLYVVFFRVHFTRQ